MFIQKVRIFTMLLLFPCLHIQAQTTPDTGTTPPVVTTTASPVMTTITTPPPSQAALAVADDCICLRDPATDNLIKNCTQQQRKNENQPRLFCFDADGVMVEQKDEPNWEKLPANHADCAPCEGNKTTTDGIPRNGD